MSNFVSQKTTQRCHHCGRFLRLRRGIADCNIL